MTDCAPKSLRECVLRCESLLSNTHTHTHTHTHTQTHTQGERPLVFHPRGKEQSGEDNLWKRRPAVKGQQSSEVDLCIIYRLLNGPRLCAASNSPFSEPLSGSASYELSPAESAHGDIGEKEHCGKGEEDVEADRRKINTANMLKWGPVT